MKTISRDSLVDRLVDWMWPFTITVGAIMAVGVFVFLAGSFILVFGAFFFGFPQWLTFSDQ